MKRFFSPSSILQTITALVIITACLNAASWQFNRGQAQADINRIISANLLLKPITSSQLADLNPVESQWRAVSVRGEFDANKQELVRNRYYEGKFGFEVLTLFRATTGENFWVDRGWVAAGPNAATPPEVKEPPKGLIEISARIRSENLSRQLQGSFFVTKVEEIKPESITKLQGVTAQPYYLDLLPSADETIKPLTEIELPELTNGPHFAYALQWLAFAVLALIGRILLFREAKRLSLV